MEYYIGIDAGTTSLKGIAFSASGKVLCEHAQEYPMHHDLPGESELEPARIWQAFVLVVENILQAFPDTAPKLVSFSSAMHSIMAVDEAGQPLSRFVTWADNRAASIAKGFRENGMAQKIYAATGVPVHPMSPFCKLVFWKEQPPPWYARAVRFIGIKEYLFFRLFGKYAVDLSVASATGLLNLGTAEWDPEILSLAGISAKQLSTLVPVRAIFTGSAVFPRLLHVPFVIGGSDGAMANAGTVGNDHRSLVVSIGTSSATRRTVPAQWVDPQMRCFCYCISEGSYLLGGAGNNGAFVLQWLREQLLETTESLPDLLAKAELVPPGADGLIFLPYLLGERAPLWNPEAKGVFFGLTARHGQAHLVRAAMEAVLFCAFAMSRPLVENLPPEKVYVTGGFARNRAWVQMLADIFRLPVALSATVENSAWGAVRTGAEAIGLALPETPAGEEVIHPAKANADLYAQIFAQFQLLNQTIAPLFR